ncbi:COG4223 family protein [Actibacterium lipolyticum]|uniref:Mitochondrial inner membrane protein n=1 Tax=Actibacterium lipolyticum TaxID=1524263 RepID=A0A238KXC3_9RHOB|nr:hypothetical protein [Actibacterium lipolyticum]SMX47221.1 hypothetical protein COL8621_03374 [Actibacterium lipolyticum]
MAGSKKSTETEGSDAKPAEETIVSEDAVVVEESETEAEPALEEPETVDQPEDSEAPEEVDVVEDLAEEAAVEAIAPTPAPQKQRSGFWGTVFGGALAAVIGFGAAQFIGPVDLPFLKIGANSNTAELLDEQRKRIETLSARVTDLSGQLKAQAGQNDTAEIEAKIEAAQGSFTDGLSQISGTVSGLSDQLGTIDTRLTEIEKRPVSTGGDISGAVDAYERELAAMRNELAAQRAHNEELAANVSAAANSATAEIDAAAARAKDLEARAAIMRVRAALEAGGGFESALSGLDGIEVPPALSATAADGVPTLQALRQGFSQPARDALDASLRAQAGDNASDRFSAFLRSQVGARSLTPREGDDPDAVLSRAEAALGGGQLAAALSEIATLPEAGQEAMSGWVAQVQTRIDALAAADDLAASLNAN